MLNSIAFDIEIFLHVIAAGIIVSWPFSIICPCVNINFKQLERLALDTVDSGIYLAAYVMFSF